MIASIEEDTRAMETQENEKAAEEGDSNTRESAVAQQPTPNRKRKAESEMFDEFVDVGGNALGDTTANATVTPTEPMIVNDIVKTKAYSHRAM